MKSNGFTLVELLVAMVAGSFLLISLSWAVASLGRELRQSRTIETRDRVAAIAPALTALVEQALPTSPGTEPIVVEVDKLAITTAPPDALGSVGPVRLSFLVRKASNLAGLYARFDPADKEAPLPKGAGVEITLIRDQRDIRFEYVRAAGRDARLPPQLVTITFTGQDGRSTRLSMTPRLNSSGDCRFDPISMTCRS